MENRNCPSVEILWQYAKGQLGPEQQHLVELHSVDCPLCAGAIEGFENTQNADVLHAIKSSGPHQIKDAAIHPFITTAAIILTLAGIWWAGTIYRTSQQAKLPTEMKSDRALAVIDSLSEVRTDSSIGITPQVMEEVYSHPATPTERKSEWGEELFMIEKRTYQPEIKKAGSPGVRATSLYKVIYVEDLKVVAHPEWNDGNRFAFELNRSIHPRYANKNQTGGEAFYSDVDTIYYDNLLRAALQAFNKGECELVSEQLEVIRSKYPDDPNARFYMAMCLERMNRYAEALVLFEKMMAEEYNVFREEAEWHTGLNLFYLGEKDRAAGVLSKIIAADGFYAGAASEELKKY
jgi:hypothetical protein